MRMVGMKLTLLTVNNITMNPTIPTPCQGCCQEIGLVAIMFFFGLFIFLMFFAISLYVSFTNLFSIIPFPYLLITRDTQDEGEAVFRFY